MDMYLYQYVGMTSPPIDVLTSRSSKEAAGHQEDAKDHSGYSSSPKIEPHQQSLPPVAVASKRCTASRSVGEINSDDSGHIQRTSSSRSSFIKPDSPSPFRRAFSNSFSQSVINRTNLRKHLSLKETKNSCHSLRSDDCTTKVAQFGPKGIFWRASKRLFSSSKLNTSSTSSDKDAKMPAPNVISRDDAQISSRRPHKSRQRQRTASPPSDLKKEKRIDTSIPNQHSSPFRSLPNAKKKLMRSLLNWTSPGSSATCVTSNAQGAEISQPALSRRGKSNNRGANTRLDNCDHSASSPNVNWKQEQGQTTSRTALNPTRKLDTANRVQECVKDLNVSLRFLDDVIKKDKLLMLDGSASIVLDTVLKLLLILNEKRRRDGPVANESQVILEAYNSVYHNLAALLKFADNLAVKNATATQTERQEATLLCQELKDSIQALLAIMANELPCEKRNSGANILKKADRGVTTDMEPRKYSLASSESSTSSSAAEWAAEDEGEARLLHLDNSFDQSYSRGHNSRRTGQNLNQQRQSVGESASSVSISRPLSSGSTSSSGCGTSKNTLLPSALQLTQHQTMLGTCTSPANLSNGSRSPPGSDSGIFSFNETGASASYLVSGDNSSVSSSSLTTVPSSVAATAVTLSSPCGEEPPGASNMLFLDEILAKLKLSGVSTATFQDQHDTSTGDVETVTEEVEEMVGDTKIIRKKIITRQKVRHQQVVTATITTHHQAIDSPDGGFVQLLSSPLLEDLNLAATPWIKRTASDGNESKLRFMNNECYRLVGGTTNQTVAVAKFPEANISCESLPPAPPPPLPPRVGRPVSNYDSEKDSLANLQSSSSKTGSETKILTNKQRQESVMQQSASLQSFSRQTLFNGKLIKTETGQKFDAAAMKASKSETFGAQGELTESRGAGSYAECGYAKGDRILSPGRIACYGGHTNGICECGSADSRMTVRKKQPGPKGLAPQPPPRPPKRSVVSSYVQLFGTGTPSNQADFRSSTLATYVQLRDRWNDHFEAHKRKAMTYQFVSSPASASSTNVNGNGAGAANGYGKTNDSQSTTSSSSSSPKINVHRVSRTFHEYEVDGEEGMPVWIPRKPQDEYQNLINILNVNDYLKLPKHAAVEAGMQKKQLPFRANLAIADVNLMDEIDVRQHLMCKKSQSDDGPEIRGGPVDALIVHATKTTSDAVAACGHISNAHGHGFCFQEAFLTTYRTFVTPAELIKKLVHRYNRFNSCIEDSIKKKAAKNTFSLLVRVVDDLSTVEITDDIMHLLGDLIFYRMIIDGELNFSRLLRQKLMERYKVKRQRALEESSPLYPTVSANGDGFHGKNTSLLDFKASHLAEQFTFLDWYYFQKIELSEMLLWAQEQSEENSPNLTNFTEHFNKMSYWVRTRILEQSDQKERERIFGKFVKIMRHLRRLNNFNSCLALLSALDSGPIRRLDWPKTSLESMNEHSSLIDSSQSFKTYRMALAEAKPPCLPYIGLILQDLTFVHIGNPNTLPPDQCQNRRDVLNFAKRWQQYTILDNMRRFKAWPYGIKKNDHVLYFLNDFNDYVSEDAMWDTSEKIKPRQQQNFVTGVARRILVSPS